MALPIKNKLFYWLQLFTETVNLFLRRSQSFASTFPLILWEIEFRATILNGVESSVPLSTLSMQSGENSLKQSFVQSYLCPYLAQ